MGPEAPGFGERRARVLEALGDQAAMVVAAAPEVLVGRDLELRYVPDPDLWYLTGYPEPEAVAVLRGGERRPAPEVAGDGTGDDGARFILFVRPRDPDRETWTGPRGGVEAAVERHGADAAYPIAELASRLPDLLRDCHRIYFRLGSGRPAVERVVLDVVGKARARRQRSGIGPAELADPGLILDDMRLIKDAHEIRAIRQAVDISVVAFQQALDIVRPGIGEWEVEAAVEAAMRRAGADGPAFATIAASGGNATVLHYTANDRRLEAGDLLLLDAGARHQHYNADLTRTVPVTGRLTGAQRDVHQAVLDAERAAIDAVRPGATTRDVHLAALKVLVPAMVDLRLLDGDPDDLIDQGDLVRRWYPHNSSHWLGLDVHDVGTYAIRGEPRRLQPGMVLTIEPGIYIPPHADDAPPPLRGIGVRIEDDILVTDDGHEVLSRSLPA